MENFALEQHKFAFERHKKACKTCARHYCTLHCKTCDINLLGDVLGDIRSCPCLNWDDSEKYARCKYYKPREGGKQ